MSYGLRLRGRILFEGNGIFISLLSADLFMLLLTVNLLLPFFEVRLLESEALLRLCLYLALLLFNLSLITALSLGCDRMLLRNCRGVDCSLRGALHFFRPDKFAELFLFGVRYGVFRLLLFAFTLSPFLLCLFITLRTLSQRTSLRVLLVLTVGCVLLFIVSAVFHCVLSQRLFLVKYYFLEGKYLSLSHCIACSLTDMKKHTAELFLLRLSFIGWLMSCIFILPAGYVFGYYRQTLALAALKFMS